MSNTHIADVSKNGDTISRQAALDCVTYDVEYTIECIKKLPSAQPESKTYTKADYVMALHKEYGCTLKRAEEAHDKALEYLRSKSMLKG